MFLGQDHLEHNPIKIGCIFFSILFSLLMIPLFYIIAQYEKTVPRKTLINQLLNYVMMNSFFANMTSQVPNILLYIVGPLPQGLCYQLTISWPAFAIGFLLLTNAISITKYTFIFHIKNPTSLQEDFWAKFILSWIIGFCFFSQLVFAILPGKNPNFSYICLGYIDRDLLESVVKKNYIALYLAYFSIILHSFVSIRCFLFNCKLRCPTMNQNRNIVSVIASRIISLEKSTLIQSSMKMISLILVIVSISFPTVINATKLEILTTYPHYLLLYGFQLLLTPFVNIAIILTVVLQNKNLVEFLRKKYFS